MDKEVNPTVHFPIQIVGLQLIMKTTDLITVIVCTYVSVYLYARMYIPL